MCFPVGKGSRITMISLQVDVLFSHNLLYADSNFHSSTQCLSVAISAEAFTGSYILLCHQRLCQYPFSVYRQEMCGAENNCTNNTS